MGFITYCHNNRFAVVVYSLHDSREQYIWRLVVQFIMFLIDLYMIFESNDDYINVFGVLVIVHSCSGGS